ncbi:unnamed protein product [Urochloa decumbens]|uniref:Rx N-terminal domain-containing protein n=1 Tax=Urochloa decumbens TaxID=240449 RepID=A0ABC8YWN8_9POAL
MEALLSAVASDLVGRLVSFLITKFQEPSGSTDGESRQVTNRAMLLQLNQLRGEMCRGVYVTDALTRRAVEPSRRRHAMARRSLALQRGSDATGWLSTAVESIEAALSDMEEFVRCMFGRQMEKEHIVSFLLQPAQDLEVLPVIGPHEVGKRTLVEHVCLEERVRDRFGKIHRLCSDDLDVQSQGSIDTAQRSLIIIDLAGGDKDEERCSGFLWSIRRRAHMESKIIIISRTEAHSGLGTVPPLRLRTLRREELWYFFKAVAFGGADPKERPELVRIAMALLAVIQDDPVPFAAVNKVAASLRADLSARSWRRVLRVSAGVTVLQLGAGEPWIYYPRLPVNGAPDAPFLFYDRRKSTGVARSELPEVTMLEVGHGIVAVGEKKFDVLLWQSRIPPYASYLATCDMERAAQVEVGNKRVLNKGLRSGPVDFDS